MHECICIFCGEYACIFVRCCEHHACAGVYVRQVLWTSAYTFAHTLATGCAYALMYVQFVHLALGNEDGGVQLVRVCESICCLAWGVIFDRRNDRGVVCVFSIFDAGGSVCGCVCVCTHTHTHTLHRWVNRLWAQESRWDTWRAGRIQRSIHEDHIGVQSTSSLSIYMLGWGFWWSGLTAFFSFNMSFLLWTVEDVTTIANHSHSLRWE